MTKSTGILLVSHVKEVAEGLTRLLDQVAGDVTIKTAGGSEDGGIGTSFDLIAETLESFEEKTIFCFFDLGSAQMNLEMAIETSDKDVQLMKTAFIEGAYTGASLLQAEVDPDEISRQLKKLVIKD
ncbi:dihydroxyacetone kinase phosphoryl donor subunit DhaM [Alkalibacterium olivapovliticus]|uniref:phosphoenolpyruvate--glycerone phosphotransferase n=1 Tax=Alkalibacterium olivapovliticus TaxID=99907 RepID=A0A2T0WAF6_9LACT|nr:dihydroxyacetone kinase phosphoryl donor subunit DhaM [Alkalibacterium olivapovliticus]PRY83677.1 dihydroxyacetone kinase phosphotransfer subunit [Alkalibacterium olivapovliticus]